jgi:hypothetical protein
MERWLRLHSSYHAHGKEEPTRRGVENSTEKQETVSSEITKNMKQ